MKVILAIANSKGRTISYVADDRRAYSLGKAPHTNPIASDRGLQIVGEFIPLAENILGGL